MTRGSLAHILFWLVLIAFWVGSMWLVSKMSRKWQNVMFVLCALACSGLIFFACGMGFKIDGKVNWRSLIMAHLQVCNFNFTLVWLTLIPKLEIARQYSVFFSMYAASTTLFALQNEWAELNWHDPRILGSLGYHALVVTLCLWMIAARRLKPRKEYIWKVTGCVFAYFTIAAIIITVLMQKGIITDPAPKYSFIYHTLNIGVLDWLYSLVPYPYFYLWTLIPPMIGFYYLLAYLFRNYEVKPYWEGKKARVAESASDATEETTQEAPNETQ